ncbi:hypothetical protein FGO68_gene1201 [Halteria grandinella]|uniref:Uncharacterized protein n=1 Tax=Halteria grandinella TaxID=5974 RepID=A0A8J8NAK6_HALGN|nr:hypothetical protein FGO68_gene1201 [Halteria grandinella]
MILRSFQRQEEYNNNDKDSSRSIDPPTHTSHQALHCTRAGAAVQGDLNAMENSLYNLSKQSGLKSKVSTGQRRIRPPRIALASYVTLSLFLLLGGNAAAAAAQDRILDNSPDPDAIRYSANGAELPRFRIDGIEPEGGQLEEVPLLSSLMHDQSLPY